jgi:hypothetical protein
MELAVMVFPQKNNVKKLKAVQNTPKQNYYADIWIL